MAYTPNNRTTIDQEVFKWVKQQKQKDKVVTVNLIRQKAFELGQELDPNFKASLNWYNNWKKRYNYSESPEAEALKHKKRHYTAAFKLHAVQRAAEMESASQAALELDVSRRCLQRWTEEVDLISSVAEHSSNAVYRRPGQGRKVVDENLDKDLVEWLLEAWKQGVNITVNTIREKAIEMSHSPGFKASLGWYMKWQKRHGVDLKERTCNPPANETASPLKLRLLQDGEVFSYSANPPARKKRKLNKSRLSYDDEALLENDEEFDRQLLTWLVERWEAGDIVTDKMVKDRAMELTTNPDFKSTKPWLMAWKRKYNISLENQTYGNEGDEEPEEIIEASEVYDQQVVLEDQQQGASTSSTAADEPLTPTKEEAATALASLSAEDHEATGIEIAEALQKLANAFGITNQDGAKEAMAQLTAAYQGENPDFLLESGGQVAVEEIVSEEVVTDEPMVVIEENTVASADSVATAVTTAPVISVSTSSTSGDNIVIETHTTPIVSTEVVQTSEQIVETVAPPLEVSPEEVQVEPEPLSLSDENVVMTTTSSAQEYVNEEVIISESSGGNGEVEVLVEGPGIVIIPTTTQDEMLQQQSSMSDITVSSEPAIITEVVTTSEMLPVPVMNDFSVPGDQVTIENVSLTTISSMPPQELIDIMQDSITGVSAGDDKDDTSATYNDEFKQKVVARAKELDSVPQAAAEFSLPRRAVASWLVETSRTAKEIQKETS